MFGGRSAAYPQADTPTTRQVFGTDYMEEEDDSKTRKVVRMDSGRGERHLKKAALVELLETLLNHIDRLEGAKNTEQQVQPDGADKPLAG